MSEQQKIDEATLQQMEDITQNIIASQPLIAESSSVIDALRGEYEGYDPISPPAVETRVLGDFFRPDAPPPAPLTPPTPAAEPVAAAKAPSEPVLPILAPAPPPAPPAAAPARAATATAAPAASMPARWRMRWACSRC